MQKKISSLRILIPDATQNYIQNPSGRFDTTGWNVFSSTLSRTLDFARFGIASLKVITTGSALREGIYYRVSNLTGVREPVTVSAYVRGAGKVRIRLIDSPSGKQYSSKAVVLSSTRWKRIEVSGLCSGGNDVRLYVETDGATAQPTTFYVDGAQMERKAYSTSYCDGDQPGCRWNIIQHASMATRDSNTREGGRWVTLSGEERIQEDLYMTLVGGLGMAPIRNSIQSFAVGAGSYFQNSKITDRVVTLTFHAKHEDLLGRDQEISLTALHRLRQFLIDTVKPDLTGGDQDFLIEYQDGDMPLYFRARYDGGLEGEWDIRNKWINSFPLRLLVVTPLIYEDDQEMGTIDFQESFFAQNIAGRVDGRWSNMNFGVNGQVDAVALGRKGEIYISGVFTQANNNNGAIAPNIFANRIAYWDGEKFNQLSSGANGRVYNIAIAPNGYVYAVGSFTTIGGVAATRAAYWDGVAWNAMGTGLNSDGYVVEIAPNGDVYVGGAFTSAGGSNSHYISRWDGTKWNVVGVLSGLNGTVGTIAISPDGLYMYLGGAFTDQFGLSAGALLCVAKYTVSTNTFAAVGSGLNNTVYRVIISPSGVVYASGAFTASGTTTCSRVAQLVGAAWAPMGSGMDGIVYGIAAGPNGDIVAVGQFTIAGGIFTKTIALWNGSSWTNVDSEFSVGLAIASMALLDVQYTPSGDIYVGGALNTGVSPIYQSLFSGITTIDNIGSSEASPFVYILGPGRLKWLENQTTKKRIFFDLTVLSGEEVFIDFGKGTIQSTVRGSLFYAMLPGSDFNAFNLIPGPNKIACLITNDVAAVMKIGYTPGHWSMDTTMLRERV